MPSLRRSTTLLLLYSLIVFAACSGDDAVDPGDPNVPCAEREAVALPVETGPVGTIRTFVGNGQQAYDGDCNAVLESALYWPADIEFTASIGTYIVDWNNHRIRRITDQGRLETVIGTSTIGDGPSNLSDTAYPGVPGTSCNLNHPTDVFESQDGKLVLVAWHNHKLREWDPMTRNEYVTIGRGPGCSGDGGQASAALVDQACHAVQAADGSIYILDQRNQCVRKIDPAGVITTVVSSPVCNTDDPGGFSGDDGDPKLAEIAQPTGDNPMLPGGGVVLDGQGRLYIADTLNHRIRRVDFGANVITTVVGDGVARYAGDNGDPLAASLNEPRDIEWGPDDRLYIADVQNNVVRAVDFDANEIVTVAGNGTFGFSGDGGPATSAQLATPIGIAFDQNGDLYIADTYNNRIRRVKMN